MARFIGNVGFGHSVEKAKGVHEDVITTRVYKGEVVRNNRAFNANQEIEGEITTSHSINIVADSYALANHQAIRFVEWGGGFWYVTTVQTNRPRLLLGLGGPYNGPKN